MKINQSFRIDRPRDVVWALFEDVPEVATCMPGAELTGQGDDGTYRGKVGVKLGPFNAAFEGEATKTSDPDAFTGHVEGKGLDKRGGSRSQLTMDYRLVEDGGATEVTIDADIRLTGPIAQFGRTGVITEAATVLIGEFVRNIERKLAAQPEAVGETEPTDRPAEPAAAEPAPAAPSQISIFALIRAMLANALRRIFGRA